MRRTFSCGHKGFGVTCHRCEESKRLRLIGQSNAPLVAGREPGWFIAEADRLAAPRKSRSEKLKEQAEAKARASES